MNLELIIFLIMLVAIIVAIVYASYLSTPTKRGEAGENYVRSLLATLPEEYKVLNDLVLPTRFGTTQIDHLVVSKYGVFAIETKNYTGNIYGNDDRYDWKVNIVTDVTYSSSWWNTYTYVTKNRMYNPVKQSLGHIAAIKNLIPTYRYLDIVPIVVFVGDCNLNGVKSKYPVIYGSNLLPLIRRYNQPIISEAAVSNIVSTLVRYNKRNEVSESRHVQHVQRAQARTNSLLSKGICPECGGNLVERRGRYGNFYGCSNYPKCRFTVKG